MSQQYSVLPRFYDLLNSEANYSEYVAYLSSHIPQKSSVIDLGCGTGNISIALAKLGYDVTGLDLSSEMLSEAAFKSEKEKVSVFYTCQDISDFKVPTLYDAAVSAFDSLNYITENDKLCAAFSRVSDCLKSGGLFLFDMNSPYKFETFYADNSFVLEEDGVFCAWENYYNKKSRKCKFFINIFAEENGVYKRYYEQQTERSYKLADIVKMLESAGFELVSVSSDFDLSPVLPDTLRYYFIARKK